MKGVKLQYHVFGHADDCRNHATCTRQIASILASSLHETAHFDDSPIDFAIETTAKSLGNMAKMHVLEVYFACVYMLTKVLVRRERRAKLNGIGSCHVAFHALPRRGSGDDSYLERMSCLVFSTGSLGEFAENCLCNAVRSEPRKGNSLVILDHRSSFFS